MSEEKVLLGRINGAHGLKGQVKIAAFTEAPEDIAAYGALTDESGARRFEISAIHGAKGGSIIASLSSVCDRDTAEKLKGTDLYVPRSALPPSQDDDEFYHSDLIGLNAVSPAGAIVGKIVAVHNFGAGDLLEVRFEGERQAELIPFETAYVPRVDLTLRQVMVIRPVYEEKSAEDP